jgi:hypothetical protein
MKKAKAFCALCALITAFAIVFGEVKDYTLSVELPASEDKADNKNIFRLLQDARVIVSNSWSVEAGESKNLTYTVQAFDQDPSYGGPGVKLSIFDQAGVVIYKERFGEVQSIYPSYALRKTTPQLIMEVSYGGSASFLKMLDYQNGKVVNLMEAVEPNNDFHVGAEVRPQFRSGINPAVEPYQVLLTGGVGLASSAKKYTNVFRYKDGAYRHIGKFSTQKLDDYIEKLVQENGSNKGK